MPTDGQQVEALLEAGRVALGNGEWATARSAYQSALENRQESVIVIGAGPAGLAVAAEFGRRGVSAVVLDRADVVGASWRDRYDRLRLNSPRWFSELPNGRFKSGTPTFPTRDQVVEYLGDYAGTHRLDVRLGIRVDRLDRRGDRWLVRTNVGDLDTGQVVIAIGLDGRPVIPQWPGRGGFEGTLLHSAQYRRAEPFRGRDVLVVGPGCSGAEIAFDLLDGGARRVRLAVRTPPNIMLRIPFGAQIASVLMHAPTSVADALMRFVQRRTIGDLTEFGIPTAEEGVFSRLRRLHLTPMIVDAEVIDAIRQRRIEIVAAVEDLDSTGVRLGDGTRIAPDAVIAATGYRPGLESLVGHLEVLDDRGFPRVIDGEALPGLRFHGYDTRPGQIRQFGIEARRSAKDVARRLARPPAAPAAAPMTTTP